MKVWSYVVSVREYFLATTNWDQLYEPGDSRECNILFYQDTNDDEKAKQHVIERARAEDIEVVILGLDKALIEVPNPPQKPIG